MKKLNLSVLGLLLAFLSLTAVAQQAANEAEQDKEKNEKKALELLEQILAESQALKLPENRLRVKAMAAAMLWGKDETRARTYFQEADNDLKQMVQTLSNETENRQRKMESFHQFRQEIIRNLSQLDPQLALDLLRSSRLPDELKRPQQGGYDPDQQLESELMTRLSSRNPAQALKTAEELLQKGYSPQILNLADSIRWNEASRPAITNIYQQLIRKLATDDLLANNDAVSAATALLQRGYSESQFRKTAGDTTTARPVYTVIDDQMFRELIEITVKAAGKPSSDNIHNNNANRLRMALQSMQPAIEKYAPAQLAALKAKPAVNTPNVQAPAIYNEFRALTSNPATTPEQLLEFVKKAPPHEQNNLYSQIAMRTLSKGDTERAKQIIDTYVKDPAAKEQFERRAEDIAMNNALQKGSFDEARQLIARIPALQRKVEQMIMLATRMATKGDKTSSGTLLEEAYSILGNQIENVQQVQTLVNLSRAFATVNAERSFELIDAMVPKFNTIIAAASVIDSFEMRNGFENGEARLSGGGYLYWLNNFNNNLMYLATIDFDRAKATAEKYDRLETRLNGLLFVTSGILRTRGQQRFDNLVPPLPPPPPSPMRQN
jgi:hypothetical protein